MENLKVLTKKREANIEFLRIIAMLMVTMIHCIDNGLLMKNIDNLSVYNYVLVTFLRTCVGIANGLFIIISGYYQINNKFNLRKILKLWGKTLFYSLFIFVVIHFVNGRTYLFQSFFPISTGIYWFISAYIALYFIAPILNIVLNKLKKNQFKFLVIVFLIMFGILKIIFIAETFLGTLFPIIMYYVVGAYIRKFVEIKPKQHYLTKFWSIALIATFLNIIIVMASRIIQNNILLIVINNISNRFLDYSNILLVFMTALLFMKFKTIEIKSNKLSKFITLLSPSMLSIYIIQENIHFRSLWRLDGVLNYSNSIVMVPYMFLVVILVFLVCLLIDLLRRGIYFAIKKIPIIFKGISTLNKKIDNISNLLNEYIS